MASVPLPERPNLEQLRKRARDVQRGVRAGDPDILRRLGLDAADPGYRLSTAQLELARLHGFASWPRLRQHVEVIANRTWSWSPPATGESVADRFLRLACVSYDPASPADRPAATALLAEHPGLPASSLAVAAVCADAEAVRVLLARGPVVDAPVGPYGWSPLMYAAYGRLDTTLDDTVETVRLLLDAGADPNDGRYFLGYPTPFTILTGVFGDGERGEPAHPHAIALARVLLAAGADPNDGQTLYNRMFATEDDFLGPLFEFGLGQGDGGPWRRRLPDLTHSPVEMLRGLLAWAVAHDQRERVALLARNGVDVLSTLPPGPGPYVAAATPIETAIRNGHTELAEQLRTLGAAEPALDPVAAFIGAALAGDAAAVRATPADVVATARQKRPALVVWAAAHGGTEAVELLVAAGFDVNALGRGDVPVEQPWQTALHTAIEHGHGSLVGRLLDLGADPTIHDHRFDADALGWAEHFGQDEIAGLLRARSAGG